MLVYSLGPRPTADRRRIALGVGTFALLGAGIFCIYALHMASLLRRKREQEDAAAKHFLGYPMDTKKVKLFDIRYNTLTEELRGRVENDSRESIAHLTLHVAFKNADRVLDEGNCSVWFSDAPGSHGLPPSETQSFATLCGFDVPSNRHVHMECMIMSAMAATQ